MGFWLTLLLTESYRATVESGAALVFTDWRQLSPTTDALQAAGWTCCGIASWHKPVSRPQKGRLKRSCEYIVWGTKGPVAPTGTPSTCPASTPRASPEGPRDRVHITQKPVEVMRDVRICPPGGTVLGPVLGSCTTGVGALYEGRKFIGVKLSEHYADIAEQRLRGALTQGDSSWPGRRCEREGGKTRIGGPQTPKGGRRIVARCASCPSARQAALDRSVK
ncbi:DNA-methyltransferase [Streptomyces sp. NPDC053079]|uniref:DNA-methyltransferase n=1 Tax=Streptomyces sp. NPDC053079 TaxID=3365697 RepID=UPI0037D22861